MSESKEPQREKYLQEALVLLAKATDLLFDTTKRKLEGRDQELFILLSSCCNTALGIQKLLHNDTHTENEAYMLMRALLERLINFHYLRVADDEEVERYFIHAYYRMYHMTNQQMVGIKGNLHIKLNKETRERLKQDPKVQRALVLFSETKPNLDWTTKSFDKRLRAVIDKTTIIEGILLLAAMVTYGDASEILHGTFYGSIFLTGVFEVGSFKDHGHPTQKEVSRNISTKLRLPLVLLASLIMATVEILGHAYNYQDLKIKAEALELEVMAVMKSSSSYVSS